VLQNRNFFNGKVKGEVKVCVADTGYARGHQDLPNGSDVDGKDATGEFNEKWDEDEGQHGTHCAGTISAKGGNNKGVVGILPNNKGGNFQVLVGKALSKNGFGSASSVMKAVSGCVEQGANVVSMSLGCNNCKTQTEEKFYTDLYKNRNILIVAAAGNSGNTARSYPASYGAVMSVGAMTQSLKRSSFSQFNDQVEIMAPGSSIKSTIPNNKYATWDGTSMATPHVAGVAGLLWLSYPQCKNYQIRNAINKSARKIDNLKGCSTELGYGLVQAQDAWNLLADNCGGDIGTQDPRGGCDQLSDGDGPGPSPTKKPTKNPNSNPSPTFTPTGTYTPTDGYTFSPTSTGSSQDWYYDDYYYNDYYEDDYIYEDDYNGEDDNYYEDDYNDDYEDDYYYDDYDDQDDYRYDDFYDDQSSEVKIEVVVKTDKYPSDTTWKLYDPTGTIIMRGGNYKAETEYTRIHTGEPGCYKFVLADVWGDGLCCSWGYGYYDLLYKGKYAVYDGGEFRGYEIVERFGECGSEKNNKGAKAKAKAMAKKKNHKGAKAKAKAMAKKKNHKGAKAKAKAMAKAKSNSD
jgi:hypothetical protein